MMMIIVLMIIWCRLKCNEKNENETKKLTEIDKLMKKYNSFDSSGSNNDDDEECGKKAIRKATNDDHDHDHNDGREYYL